MCEKETMFFYIEMPINQKNKYAKKNIVII